MSDAKIWWSSMAVTTEPQPTDRLRLTWFDDPEGSLDMNRYDHHAHVGKVIELNAVFTEFNLVGRRYRVVKVTKRTPLTHVVPCNEVELELSPVT